MRARGWVWKVEVAVAVVFIGGAAAADNKKPGLFDFQAWKTPVTREREAAQQLAPVPLDVTPLGGAFAQPRVMRVRFYVDEDYRAGVLHWQNKLRTQVERVDAVLAPLFGVRLEIESTRDWDRGHAGVALAVVGDELEKLDGAKDVDWVVGLVTPFHGVASSMHIVGLAADSSRHFVMRGMDDVEEGKALDREFEMLGAGERDKLYADRKAHKELVMFLHEWAHTLGALHVDGAGLLMNPVYDPHQAAFTDFEKRLIGVVLARRLADRQQPFPENAELLALIEKGPRDEGSDAERADLIRFLRARGTGGHARTATTEAPVAASSGGPAPPALAQAIARLQANDLAGATPLVFAAAKQASAGAPDAATLVRLAQAAAAVGAFTTADAALARAGRAAPHALELAADLSAERARDALPVGAAALGIAPEDEPRYVAMVAAALRSVGSLNRAAAADGLATLDAAFPASAGREVVACELGALGKQAGEARKHCEAALAKDPDATRAHLVLARLDARAKHDVDAEKHLRRVIFLDPKAADGWSALWHLYGEMGSSIKRDSLERQYEALFSAPLPR